MAKRRQRNEGVSKDQGSDLPAIGGRWVWIGDRQDELGWVVQQLQRWGKLLTLDSREVWEEFGSGLMCDHLLIGSQRRLDAGDHLGIAQGCEQRGIACTRVLGRVWEGHQRTDPPASALHSVYWSQFWDRLVPSLGSHSLGGGVIGRLDPQRSSPGEAGANGQGVSAAESKLAVGFYRTQQDARLAEDLLSYLGFQAILVRIDHPLPECPAKLVFWDDAGESADSQLGMRLAHDAAQRYPSAVRLRWVHWPQWPQWKKAAEGQWHLLVRPPVDLEGLRWTLGAWDRIPGESVLVAN
jgi:hypothetical protein